MSTSFVLAQISDLHIGAGVGPAGRDAAQGLRAALQAIGRRAPDAILATGDLANDCKAEEYAELAALLAEAPAPIFLLPGNHDDADLLRAAFPQHLYLPRSGPLSYALDQFPVRIVAIDETIPGEVGGDFTEAHARWLDALLAEAPEKPTIVALHHPPFASHDRLFDTLGLAGAERFAAVIARHAQVKRIVCGHHHRVVTGAVAHAPAVMAPSTAWSYDLALRANEQVGRRTVEPCGFLLHVWSSSSGLVTHVFAT
jgi:3',5'-cyclic AMP phosphodiesterase CpdA